ncbi:MAG TPA: carbon-nitrogen hydrolase family protein [Cyclobacteriaceae bacterium]|nr:carbon-nitrogen hydrolase family protein [Cyclobacteriaceae bacterium]HRK54747.1 carbon-nitrogen hydrolase family protein [Cyclobacteriaceae bacterium]
MANIVKVGIGQFSSVHLNLPESLHKLESIVADASQQGVKLLVVGETWLSGYPSWLDHCTNVSQWDGKEMKEVYLQFYNSSVDIKSKDFERVCNMAKSNKVTMCIGLNEKVNAGPGNGTVYNSFVIISHEGELLNHHRKLMPTFTEKMLYGLGDGHGLKAVDTEVGRVGASICWEHWMPLTRQALHDSGEHIHIALWPKVHEMHQVASRQYAFEGRCFVLAAGQMLKASDFPKSLEQPDYLKSDLDQWTLNGGSCVVTPNGSYLVEPVFDEEKLIICELNLDEAIKERMTLDTSGHYQRRDVFDFKVDRSRMND